MVATGVRGIMPSVDMVDFKIEKLGVTRGYVAAGRIVEAERKLNANKVFN